MSPKSIGLYQARFGKPATVAERLRALASKERAAGCRRLALASELDEIADLADEKPAMRCDCGAAMTFALNMRGLVCWCPRCKERSERDGHTVFVYGYGRDNVEAFRDWRNAIDRA